MQVFSADHFRRYTLSNAYLATSVSELNTNLTALVVNKVNNTFDGGDMLVLPDTSVAGRDTSAGLDSSGLGQDKASAVGGKASKMHQMKVGHEAILGREHAHGGDHDPVGQSQILDGEGLEQKWDFVGIRQGGVDGAEV